MKWMMKNTLNMKVNLTDEFNLLSMIKNKIELVDSENKEYRNP